MYIEIKIYKMLIKYILLALMLSSVWADDKSQKLALSLIGQQRTTKKPKIEQGLDYCGISMHEVLRSRLFTYDDDFAKFGEFPWTVAIYFKEKYLVAGTLLKRDFVLTTTKSIENKNEKELIIVAGDWDIASELEEYPELKRNVRQTYTNEEITLIRLDLPFSRQRHIGFLCLPTSRDSFILETVINTGWQKTNKFNGIAQTNKLRKKSYRIMAPIDCFLQLPDKYKNQAFDRNSSKVSDLKYICAKDEMNVDSCPHNDGDALFYFWKENKYNILAGIALTTDNCSKNNPALFINVTYYVDWIAEILGLIEKTQTID